MTKRRVLVVSAQIVALLGAMVAGMLLAKYDLPPYTQMRKLFRAITDDSTKYEETSPVYRETDVRALIGMSNQAEATSKRKLLIDIVWGGAGLPVSPPDSIMKGVESTPFNSLDGVESVSHLLFEMEFGIDSNVYQLIPSNPNGQIIFYHQGHAGDVSISAHHLETLTQKGYEVYAFTMPLIGSNSRPYIEHPKFGKLHINEHDRLALLQPEFGHPVQYLIEPVVRCANHVSRTVSMIGLSGGAWTTTVAAALDKRIKISMAVAGTLPMYLRSDSQDWSDWESQAPGIYANVNYLELYVLAASGVDRKHIQVINKYDEFYFYGTRSETYGGAVADVVEEVGAGEYQLVLDDSHKKHAISAFALNLFMDSLD